MTNPRGAVRPSLRGLRHLGFAEGKDFALVTETGETQ
jgi:hypothetical protein